MPRCALTGECVGTGLMCATVDVRGTGFGSEPAVLETGRGVLFLLDVDVLCTG